MEFTDNLVMKCPIFRERQSGNQKSTEERERGKGKEGRKAGRKGGREGGRGRMDRIESKVKILTKNDSFRQIVCCSVLLCN
jgi:hypothetical protein